MLTLPTATPRRRSQPSPHAKFEGKSGLRYEIALEIMIGEIKWVNGAYQCKDWFDIAICCHGLKHFLNLNERVEADDRYVW